nr:ASN_HP1_G0034380.mRNA.1.CDS.1 [Saccharomyces cerevisiae]
MSSNEEVFTQINATANVVDNKKRLLFVQDSSALVLGLVAGFLQIESVHGFIWFLILYNLINVIYIVWICQLQPGKFYQNSCLHLIQLHSIVVRRLGIV